MLALCFTFPAGRYHANPWDRHVNEGEVAWPPDPWRLLRALIATWHHKVKPLSRYTDATLIDLIDSLAQALPEYTLPAATHSHTRHYLPQWKTGTTSLVFDAFAAVDRNSSLYMTWPQLDLPADQAALLDDLLVVIGYLGRAESWVEAARVDQTPAPNCMPGDEPLDRGTGELYGEVVNLFAPVTPAAYAEHRASFLTDKKKSKKFAKTLPDGLVAALSVDTSDLQKQGWSQPPAMQKVSYLRPVDALRPVRTSRKVTPPLATTVRYLLVGKPLPRMEDAVRIGELLRLGVMTRAKKLLGEDGIPSVFSGHDMPANNRHAHAFYLPWDKDGDGRIDRLLLHVPAGLGSEARHVLEHINRMWSRDGHQWALVLEGMGEADIGGNLFADAQEWHSITPYLHPWHVKKGFQVEDQIRRECRERGLPEPVSVERLETVKVGHQTRRPIHFHRFRNKRGLQQPDRQGSFWRLIFSEPLPGPLALGFACHFGLGLFKPVRD